MDNYIANIFFFTCEDCIVYIQTCGLTEIKCPVCGKDLYQSKRAAQEFNKLNDYFGTTVSC